MYRANLEVIWRYFASSDFIYLAVFSKICLVVFLVSASSKAIASSDKLKIRFSILLTIFFIIYFFAIARIPNFPYTRYFIPLQPILALVIILDLVVVYNFIARYRPSVMIYARSLLTVIVAVFVVVNISTNYEYLKGHLFEMTHQYKGPLDYVIPYIKERYKNTDNLVIATDHEETSFMYYLNAKVIIGYVGNNLEQDSQIIPDIIVYRKGHEFFLPIFLDFLKRQQYERISFPVINCPVNNLPELNWVPPDQHQFWTGVTLDERKKMAIFVRQ